MEQLKPWQVTPTALMHQAIDFLQDDTEVNRQIAYLLTDAGVETLFKTYLLLPDSISGATVPYKKRAEATENNFHVLVDMIKKAASNKINDIDLESVKYYHSIRNKLYHQGDGIIPTKENAQSYLNIAVELYYRLLSLDLRSLLQKDTQEQALIKDRNEKIDTEFIPIKIKLEKISRTIEKELKKILEETESDLASHEFIDELVDYFRDNQDPAYQQWKIGLTNLIREGLVLLDNDGNVIERFKEDNRYDIAHWYVDERPGKPPPTIPEVLWDQPNWFDEDIYFEILIAEDLTEALIIITNHIKDFPVEIDVDDYRNIVKIRNWHYDADLSANDFDSILADKLNHGSVLLEQYINYIQDTMDQ